MSRSARRSSSGSRVLGWAGALRRRFPLTGLGLTSMALAAAAFALVGWPRADYVVRVVSAAVFGLVAFGGLSVLLGVLLVRTRLRRLAVVEDPLELEARRGHVSGRPPIGLAWLPIVEVEAEVVEPAGLHRADPTGAERLEARHRSAGHEVRRRYRVEDAFGLVRWTWTDTEARAVRVGPWLGGLERSASIDAWSFGENLPHPRGRPLGDPIEMSPYTPGDPLRLVLWKVYARTGELLVRSEEHALDESSRVHAFLVAGDGDEASAAVAWIAVKRRLLGMDWRFGTEGLPEGTSDAEAALDAIAGSRLGFRAETLDRFMDPARHESGARALLFVPAIEGAWLEPVAALARAFPGRVSAVLGHDAPSAPAGRIGSALRAADSSTDLDALAPVEQVEALRAQLERAGLEVFVVERSSGRPMHRAPRRAA